MRLDKAVHFEYLRKVKERVDFFPLKGLKVELESIELEREYRGQCLKGHALLDKHPLATPRALEPILQLFRPEVVMQTLLNGLVGLLGVLVAYGQRDIHVGLRLGGSVLAAVDVGLHAALEQLLDPPCVFVGLFDGFEQLAAEFLHVVLLERFLAVPLEAFEQRFGVARSVLGLQHYEESLQLVGNAVFLADLFGVMPR